MKKLIVVALLLSIGFLPATSFAFFGLHERGSQLQRLDTRGHKGEIGRLAILTNFRSTMFNSELPKENVINRAINRYTFSREDFSDHAGIYQLRQERKHSYDQMHQRALDGLRRVDAFDFDFHIPLRMPVLNY